MGNSLRVIINKELQSKMSDIRKIYTVKLLLFLPEDFTVTLYHLYELFNYRSEVFYIFNMFFLCDTEIRCKLFRQLIGNKLFSRLDKFCLRRRITSRKSAECR